MGSCANSLKGCAHNLEPTAATAPHEQICGSVRLTCILLEGCVQTFEAAAATAHEQHTLQSCGAPLAEAHPWLQETSGRKAGKAKQRLQTAWTKAKKAAAKLKKPTFRFGLCMRRPRTHATDDLIVSQFFLSAPPVHLQMSRIKAAPQH